MINTHYRLVKDCLSEIEVWKEQGNQLAIMMDVKKDVRVGALQESLAAKFLLENFCMRQSHLAMAMERHQPIDGIFSSPTLWIIQGNYLPFGQHVTPDHREILGRCEVPRIFWTHSSSHGNSKDVASQMQEPKKSWKHSTQNTRPFAAEKMFKYMTCSQHGSIPYFQNRQRSMSKLIG